MSNGYDEKVSSPIWVNLIIYGIGLFYFWIIIEVFLINQTPFDLSNLEHWIALIVPLFFPGIPLLFGRLHIYVKADKLFVEFGYVKIISQEIPLADIKVAEAVSYRPLRQFGGWGIRGGKIDGERVSVYSLKGNTGVLLTLSKARRISLSMTRKFLVGSLDPEVLARALSK